MVFAYLVAPAIIALASRGTWLGRLLVAWTVGLISTLVGLGASYKWDLPSGPAIVCSMGLILVLFALGRIASRARARNPT